MLSIGYGVAPPKTRQDCLLSIIFMLMGAILFAIFVGVLTTQIQKLDSSHTTFKEELMQIKQYMRFHKLPQMLRERVIDYHENRFNGMFFDEEMILEELNPILRAQVLKFTRSSKNEKCDAIFLLLN